eukprot:gnl/Spiro4/221_TR127_c0_g1_i1.p1 gnl/Spiro4/221_TR127_c0_g1~~gnl/Spiro4/221_TR127_c0_g1_i1.p1  ORF type:complete len:160 (-),score=12.13 gnl/Spiro4/221_TR127_c0_g1_i1:21-464(-)
MESYRAMDRVQAQLVAFQAQKLRNLTAPEAMAYKEVAEIIPTYDRARTRGLVGAVSCGLALTAGTFYRWPFKRDSSVLRKIFSTTVRTGACLFTSVAICWIPIGYYWNVRVSSLRDQYRNVDSWRVKKLLSDTTVAVTGQEEWPTSS